MLNVIPFFYLQWLFVLCFHLNTCWWIKLLYLKDGLKVLFIPFLKNQTLLFFHVPLHKFQLWRSLCCLCLFNMIVWKMAKPSQFRFWMGSRYSLMFSASKSHTIPSLVLAGQMICPPSLWECFLTGFFPVFVWKLQRTLHLPLDIWKYQAFSIPKAPSFSVQQTCTPRRSLFFHICFSKRLPSLSLII